MSILYYPTLSKKEINLPEPEDTFYREKFYASLKVLAGPFSFSIYVLLHLLSIFELDNKFTNKY